MPDRRGAAETPQRGCEAVRARPGSKAGPGWHLFKASPSFLALPGLAAPCSRGRQSLIRAYLLPIECLLCFVFAAASCKQMGWGGQRNQAAEVGPPQGRDLCPGPFLRVDTMA